MSTTSSLLRQAIIEMEAALDAAAKEYGPDSVEVDLISDALIVMHEWMRNYTAVRSRAKEDDDPT